MENLFGKAYETIGNINSDLLLKTRGEIKMQIGNQYLDLSSKLTDLENRIKALENNNH